MAVGVCHTEEIEKSDINFKTEIAVDPPNKNGNCFGIKECTKGGVTYLLSYSSQFCALFETQAENGMEEVLFGCDIGAFGISTKHWLPYVSMA